MSDCMVQRRPTDKFPRLYERILTDVNAGDPQAPNYSSYLSRLPKDLDRIDSNSGRHRDVIGATGDPFVRDASISSLHSTIQGCKEMGKRCSRLLYKLGCALMELLNVGSALSKAIDSFQEVLSYVGIPHGVLSRTPVVNSLVDATSMTLEPSLPSGHRNESSNTEDPDEWITHFLALLGIHAHTDACRRLSLPRGQFVARALLSLVDDEPDLNKAISNLRTAIDVCQDNVDIETYSLLFAELGESLYGKFHETMDVDALDESIAMFQKALNLRSSGDQTRLVSQSRVSETDRMHMQADGFTDSFFWRIQLSAALADRLGLSGEVSHLDELIECGRSLIDTCPDKFENMPRSMLYSGLAKPLRLKFERTGNCEALDEAIEMFRKALELLSSENQNHPMSLQRRWGNSDECIEAQDFTRSAMDPDEVADHAELLILLAHCLTKRFEERRNAQDSTDAIRIYKEALNALPSDSPDRCAILESISEVHMARYDVDGDIQDLNEATALIKAAEDTCPMDSERRGGVCASKARTLLRRYELHQDEKYLNEAIPLLEQALESLPPTYPDRHVLLQNLSRCFENKFKSSGDVTHLDKALHLARELERQPYSNDVMRFMGLSHVASLLLMRHEQTTNEQDLDDASSIYSRCLQLTPPDHSDRYLTLSDLGTAKIKKYDSSRDVRDLDEVVSLFREALGCCPKNNVARGLALGNLAMALGDAFCHSKSLAHLDEAIAMYKEALGLYPLNHMWRITWLVNYAILCKKGYFEHGRNEDLQEALDRFREAESSLPEHHPMQCGVRVGIAELYFRGHNQTGESIGEALSMYRTAVQHATASTEHRFIAANNWAESARELRHGSIIEAYSHVMNLLERRLLTNPTAELQHQLLTRLPKSFASDVAASVIEAGDVEAAVVLLEQGRGLLWTQLSRYKHPLDALEKANPTLAEKFKTVSRMLEQLALSLNREASSTEIDSRSHTPLDEQMKDLHSLSKEWEEIVEQIRTVNGFSDFLCAVPFTKLQKAATDGPVIIVNVSRYRCDAIIIRDGESPVVVPLPELSLKKLFDANVSLLECFKILHGSGVRLNLTEVWKKIVLSMKKWFKIINEPSNTKQRFTPCAGIENVLRYLWRSIASPVVIKLNELSIKPQSRIWWSPTSLLCHLPLHAAGTYEDGMPNLPDLFISSYLISLSSSDSARRDCHNVSVPTPRKPRALLIGCTGEGDCLDNVREEIDQIADLWPTNNRDALTILFNEDANRDNVLSQLPHHAWVHFTCHGNQGEKPLDSSLLLDGNKRLTLLDLLGADAKNAELAILSACNTATGDIQGTSDEGLHLAAAMQYCGFRSIVGTLWPMADIDGPDVARDFYEYLLNEGKCDYRTSAVALHHAVQQMRNRGVSIDRWINFVHFGA